MLKHIAEGPTDEDRGPQRGQTSRVVLGRHGRLTPYRCARLTRGILTIAALLVGLALTSHATPTTSGVAAMAMSAGASGDLEWVQSAGGGVTADWGLGVAVDASGAATVTGRFQESATFGTGDDAVTVTSSGGDDVFLARYLSDGTLDWAQRAGGTEADWGYAVAVDASGAATVTGHFAGEATFGTGADAVTLTSVGLADVFLARYLPDGTLDWARRAGGTGFDLGWAVAVEGSGAATVTGSFQGSATFGTGADTVTVTSAGGTIDLFLARYLPDGTLDWAQQAGGTSGDVGRGVAVDGSGAATVTGSFEGSATFGVDAAAVTLTSAGQADVFLARYLPDGSLDAVQRAGGTSDDVGTGVAVDASGAVTITGIFAGSATFGTGASAATVTSTGGANVFVARYGIRADSVPPTVTVPGDISVDASALEGATVGFTVSAVDDVDGLLVPVCEPPAGSTFPIGTTTVTCTATDTAGNTGQASFEITVQPVAGPEGVATLTDGVEALGLPRGVERSLLGPLSQAARLLGDHNPSNDVAVCDKLTAFTDAVAARLADGSLTADQAALLTTYAEALALVLDCHTS